MGNKKLTAISQTSRILAADNERLIEFLVATLAGDNLLLSAFNSAIVVVMCVFVPSFDRLQGVS